jgi:NB-ARC domain
MVPIRQNLYSVPLRTVSSFTAREQLSSSIGEKLRNMPIIDTGVPRILVLFGLGGIGKTQLALHFVEEHQSDFTTILWIDGNSQETIRASFERCASDLGLSVDRAYGEGVYLREMPAVRSVLSWFQRTNELNSEWLVVIDNADNTTNWNIEDIIPQGGNGNVIITSRGPQTPKLLKRRCESIEVKEMNRAEASNLLLEDLELESLPSDVRKAVDDILDVLDGFPLAIDLARSYLVMQPDYEIALKQYSIDLARHKDDLLMQNHFHKLSSYQKTVWTVWDTTLSAIDNQYPELNSSLLLTFLFLFDRGNVQDGLFSLASLGFPALPGILRSQYESLPEWFKKWITVTDQKWDSYLLSQKH